MKLSDVKTLYEKRDKMSQEEQKLEEVIFDVDKEHSTEEIKALIGRYQKIKDKRNYYSLLAAEGFMSLTPEERVQLSSDWLAKDEGVRKAEGTGIRGTQDHD